MLQLLNLFHVGTHDFRLLALKQLIDFDMAVAQANGNLSACSLVMHFGFHQYD